MGLVFSGLAGFQRVDLPSDGVKVFCHRCAQEYGNEERGGS